MNCLSDDLLAAYLECEVSARERFEVEAHLGECRDCSAHVASFARLAASPEAGSTIQDDPAHSSRGAAWTGVVEPATLPGSVIAGRFSIDRELGRGGMGVVYRGHDRQLDRPVAIKVVAPRFSDNPEAEPRFLRECRLAARMSHVNAVMVLDHGRIASGQLYLVMELLIGRTLREHLDSGPLGEARALHIGSQICDALDAAHRLRIIHRDLKPSNVIVLDDPPGRDFIKVLDFGIARSLVSGDDVTLTNVAVGTPAFSAPEVLAGGSELVDERADLYSLGVVIYWMLAGRPPFGDTSPMDKSVDSSDTRPRPIGHARGEVSALVEQLLDTDPYRRPATAAEVRARLRELAASVWPSSAPEVIATTAAPAMSLALAPTLPAEASPEGRTAPVHRHRRVALALLGALMAAALGVGLQAVLGSSDKRPAAPAAAAPVQPAPRTAEPRRGEPEPERPQEAEVAPPLPDAGADLPVGQHQPPPKKRKKPARQKPEAKPTPDKPASKADGRPDYFRP